MLGILGTLAELLLEGHTEDRWQLVPVVLLPLSLVVVAGEWWRPRKSSRGLLRATMALLVLAGGAGVYLHHESNREFEQEMYPQRAGWELLWESLHGAIPSLAPGALVQLGLLGLLCSWDRAQGPSGGGSNRGEGD